MSKSSGPSEDNSNVSALGTLAGAIRSTDTNLSFEGEVIFKSNTANNIGGKKLRRRSE